MLLLTLGCETSFAAPPFRLTTAFDIGGGGCVGETRVYEESTITAERNVRSLDGTRDATGGPLPWREVRRRLTTRARYFLSTVGCGADRVAISIDGRAHLLEGHLLDTLGAPVTYYSDAASSPRVRIEKLSTLHTRGFVESDCTQRFERVRVRIEFEGAATVVRGVAVNDCP